MFNVRLQLYRIVVHINRMKQFNFIAWVKFHHFKTYLYLCINSSVVIIYSCRIRHGSKMLLSFDLIYKVDNVLILNVERTFVALQNLYVVLTGPKSFTFFKPIQFQHFEKIFVSRH